MQDLGRLFWDRDEIRRRLADKLGDAFDRVWDVSHEQGISLRDAALVAAIREVAAALEARGIVPVSGQLVRDAMVPEPLALEADRDGAARRARRSRGPRFAPCSSCDEGRLVGVVTRKTLVREVVAAGRDPRTTLLGEIAEAPESHDRRPRCRSTRRSVLEELDLERVPVVDGGRLVGVLSRSVVQRRLAEDEPPSELEALELGRC